MINQRQSGVRAWFRSGEPWIWMNAAAVGISIAAVTGILLLIAYRGFAHFWPAPLYLIDYTDTLGNVQTALGEVADVEQLPAAQFLESTGADPSTLPPGMEQVERWLIKTGNRRTAPPDFRWIVEHQIANVRQPADAVVLERVEWGNAYGYLRSVLEAGESTSHGEGVWQDLQQRLERVTDLRERTQELERGSLFRINYQLERLRLERRALELENASPAAGALADIAASEAELRLSYETAEAELRELRADLHRDAIELETATGQTIEISLAEIMRAWRPNTLSGFDRLQHFAASFWSFLTEDPREANTEGGIFPAIFGTVMMVLLMSVLVTPFGVVAAIYLREYAHQGAFVRLVRIAVNNLAGVPSIVYGVFGLGFFVYFLGGSLDALFYPEALPAPTFGTHRADRSSGKRT
jgi:phosphate transport system permease protein